MELWTSFWSDLTHFIGEHGLLTVAGIVFLKSAGIPLPVPGDLLVVSVGAQARTGDPALGQALVVLSVAVVLGASLLYSFARWLGPEDVVHYGHYVGLGPQRVQAAEARLHARGERAILAARLLPGLRLAIVVVCGTLGVPPRVFVAPVCVAAVVYTGVCLALGYVVGPQLVDTIEQLVFPVGVIVSLSVLSILLVWLFRARRSVPPPDARPSLSRGRRVRAGIVAGAIAAGGSAMVANLLLYVGGPVVATLGSPPRVPFGRLAEDTVMLWPLLFALVLVTLLGLILGAMYGAIQMQTGWSRAPDWLRGVAFSAFPLALSLLVLAPTIVGHDGASPFWLLAVIGEAARWATYGVLLGLVYPVFQARRADGAQGAEARAQHGR
jgi:membrane protein DedA with SNARE-associated domain